ncbi:hypothetical protein N8072_00320 [bacterium]|nr:hypothetical protein [bacterium]MDB4128673.1 hypothetical protein [bacterium]MDC1257105.1 hypothetical protein [bacterium]
MTNTQIQTYNTQNYNNGYLISEPDVDGEYHVILTDADYWGSVYADLQIWCKEVDAHLSGMVIDFKTEQDLMMFSMRWK